jgi:hypothetical protein
MDNEREANYHEFTTLPAYTAAVWEDGKVKNEADPYKWSGSKPPPKIGTRVKVYLNNLGSGTVIGYFAEYGWLGVRVRLVKKTIPDWRRKQWPDNPPAHLFGLDLEPRRKPAGEVLQEPFNTFGQPRRKPAGLVK